MSKLLALLPSGELVARERYGTVGIVKGGQWAI